DREQVKLNLAKLFKVEPARVEPMFSGKRVVIKAQLDQATAQKYQAALKSAGAICEVINTAATAKPAAPQAAARPPATPNVSQPTARPQSVPAAIPTEASASIANRPVAPTPQWQVDQPGVMLVAPKVVQPLQVDLSALSMAEPGVVLVQHKDKVAPAINTGHLSVAEAGSDLTQRREVPDLQVDLSALSMAEPGVALVESKPVQAPKIDISKLSMS
ncbi:MAG TPA: hypothetical protein VGE00_07770, partial [Gammaproteobacteria bacterium]